ncbi:LuxR C-terminal-related transcriptional regulator [Povalibacter sp.]|uniref:LuxR C-terminal-related transcriptional regulator n=1 Tax=Povalibacter sp. TaxID=1962978 RepID=UPI002F4169BA
MHDVRSTTLAPRNHLLRAKLTPPQSAPFQIARTQLCERICTGVEKLVLVQAPAGFGKTTLMLQAMSALQQQGVRTSWLTVDAADNDVGRFLSFLGAAIDRLVDHTDSPVEEQGTEATGLMALDLIDRVSLAAVPFVLFVDDVEAIQNVAAFALVRQVIEHLPAGGRVVIGSRMVPDIGIARLLARGQLLEVEPAQLRFSLTEAGDFLQARRGLKLQSGDIARLQGVTEGWPVALWLASLALERRERPSELVAHFSGSNAAVADYLAEEVLAQQPEHVRDFMLRTSILHQMNAQLCDAVRGSNDSREILEHLERTGLFVQPLSEERDWFRYHSLFGSFLRTQLERTSPQNVSKLHRAAAGWYEAQRRPIPAIEHALASGDSAYAFPLLDSHAERLLDEGRFRLLARLLDAALPEDLVHWPGLRLMHAWSLSFSRGGQDGIRLLESIERVGPLSDDLQAHALALRPMILNMLDRLDEAYAAGLAAIDKVTPRQPFPYSILRTTLANLYVIMGKYANARELLDRSRGSQDAPVGPFMMIFAQCVDGVIDLLHGRLRQATARFRHSASIGSRSAFIDTNGNAMAGILLSEVLYEQNELPEAERLLNVYVPLMQELAMADHLICGYRILARIAWHRGEHDRALQIVTELEFIGHRIGLSRAVASAQLERARLALWSGDTRGAKEALQRARVTADWSEVANRSLFGNDADTLAEGQLRWMIHSGAAEEAVPELKLELERAEGARRHRRALRLRILLALALDRSGNEKAAMRTLRDALRFGSTEKFVRMFLDEGEPFRQLLQKLSAARQADVVEGVADALQYFQRLTQPAPTPPEPGAPLAAIGQFEALTRKELEILQLLAEGLSNLAIAGRLFVSETTVRTHLRNINAKFRVHNRTQAIAVGRKLRLIA